MVDRAEFWLFMAGIYRDDKTESRGDVLYIFLIMIVTLFIERFAINWLTDRNGCTFSKFQKFIEMDLRN